MGNAHPCLLVQFRIRHSVEIPTPSVSEGFLLSGYCGLARSDSNIWSPVRIRTQHWHMDVPNRLSARCGKGNDARRSICVKSNPASS